MVLAWLSASEARLEGIHLKEVCGIGFRDFVCVKELNPFMHALCFHLCSYVHVLMPMKFVSSIPTCVRLPELFRSFH